MTYADYSFYTETYKGVLIPEADFDNLSQKATDYVSAHILVQIDEANLPTELKKCVCRIAEITFVDEHNLGQKLASESVGEYSRSFQGEKTQKSYEARCDFAMKLYLGKTGLLYKGL